MRDHDLPHAWAPSIGQPSIDWAVRVRRELHRFPELGFDLPLTRALLARHVLAIGLQPDPKAYGQSGLVVRVDGKYPGPTRMIRADMDGLPIQEASTREWRSEISGQSHACGHDGHMAVALLVARELLRRASELTGSVVFCFQPSEEPGGGATAMILDGVLDDVAPDFCLGVHLWSELQTGEIAVSDDASFDSSDKLEWSICGQGGHGAMPHLAQDTVSALASIITSNSEICARQISAKEPVVVSIGKIAAGSAHNVIPSQITVSGTLRTTSLSTRDLAVAKLREASVSIGGRYDVDVQLAISGTVPPCVNSPAVATMIRTVAARALGDACRFASFSTMASDDMAEFLTRIPGCYFLVGCGSAEKGIKAPHHTPEFDLDEDAIVIAAEILVQACLSEFQISKDTPVGGGPR